MIYEKKYFINHTDDLVEIALKIGFSATKFLTPKETSEIIGVYSNRKDIAIITEGGWKDAERVRIIFLNNDWGIWSRKDVVSVLRFDYNPQYKIGHRDVLGAVMNLGVKRETLGDIFINDSRVFLICLPEITEYIMNNITKISRIGVAVERVPLELLPDKQDNITIKTITVSSTRLDSIISGAFHVARGNASKLITQGRVKVGYMECFKQDKEVSEDAVISVRGYGRVKLLAMEGRTRKDRIRLKIGLYSNEKDS